MFFQCLCCCLVADFVVFLTNLARLELCILTSIGRELDFVLHQLSNCKNVTIVPVFFTYSVLCTKSRSVLCDSVDPWE